ncbi:ribosomal S15, mitochondrial-like [Octopus vulgaris]|uniref:Small ribosomal subunit protein uS15m n=1 Tax=Octopus vulgaris TaxID=6645 RepID=A0AA36FGE7_OCTVU|nr:ribosomal S15, mitochondrial-like [Octopus vulgaris]
MAARFLIRNIFLAENPLFKIQQPRIVAPLLSGNFQNVPSKGDRRFYSRVRKKERPLFPKLFKSGDRMKREPLPDSTIKFWCQDIKELPNVPDNVRRLFTIEFASRQEIRDHEHHMLLEKIQEALGPDAFLEKKIAYLTLRIRALKKHLTSFRKDKVSKSMLSEKIAKRRKMLKELKKQNMFNFLWLTRELKVMYAPVPKYRYWPLSRKGSRKRKAHKKAFRMKIQKIETLREKYRTEKIMFDAYKAETLSQIEKDLKELNLSIDDVYDPVALSKKERVKKEKVQFQGRIWY